MLIVHRYVFSPKISIPGTSGEAAVINRVVKEGRATINRSGTGLMCADVVKG